MMMMMMMMMMKFLPWESNRTRTERTELEPTFWEEQNRTRTHVEKTYIELEPNRNRQCDEPEPSDPGSGWVRQICRSAGTFAVNAQDSSAILPNSIRF